MQGSGDDTSAWHFITVDHGISWSFTWADTGICDLTCDDILGKFNATTACKAKLSRVRDYHLLTFLNTGVWNSHVMAKSGSLSSRCGNATFSISTSPAPPERYNMTIHQE